MTRRRIPSSGEMLPVVGLGTWQTFDVGPSAAERTPRARAIEALFAAGGSVIDSSPMYGRSEAVAGDLLAEAGTRGKAFIATKVWTSGREAGIAQMQQSMRLLRTDRIDLMQIHNLLDWQAHLPTLRAWKKDGRLRYLGVTHYTASAHDSLVDVLRAEGVDIAVLEAYVRYRQPLRFDDQVTVHLLMGAATRTTFQMAYLLTVDGEARATAVTMNRDRIRDLAATEQGLRTARFAYAESAAELAAAAEPLGWPVVVKPVMSSSGKGQSVVSGPEGIAAAWEAAMAGARGSGARVIVEEFLRFEQEITLLTVKQWNGPTLFCPPIGHIQERGDYQCSWQPAHLDWEQLAAAQSMARQVTDNLGGAGLFGVEFFVCPTAEGGSEVVFSELSPRPHDTGLVTLADLQRGISAGGPELPLADCRRAELVWLAADANLSQLEDQLPPPIALAATKIGRRLLELNFVTIIRCICA